MASNKLVLGTGNPGKVRELRELFRGLPFDLMSLKDFAHIEDVSETGSTFEENAILKARGFAAQTGHLALADDSGLEVEALGNAPGVLSARFAGVEAGYPTKMQKLLDMLAETGDQSRRARFVCVMALVRPGGDLLYTAAGTCPGTISTEPFGTSGFGYDPIFVPDGFDRSFGELGDEVKSQISHRARAAELIIRYLLDFTGL